MNTYSPGVVADVTRQVWNDIPEDDRTILRLHGIDKLRLLELVTRDELGEMNIDIETIHWAEHSGLIRERADDIAIRVRKVLQYELSDQLPVEFIAGKKRSEWSHEERITFSSLEGLSAEQALVYIQTNHVQCSTFGLRSLENYTIL